MRKAWKKAVSVLLTLVLIFGVLPGMNVSANEGGQGSRSIELNFAGTVNGSIVTYGVEGTDVALTVEGAVLNDSKVSISTFSLLRISSVMFGMSSTEAIRNIVPTTIIHSFPLLCISKFAIKSSSR